jgi:3D (Asp-Asp-Asp) domain-containing protein
MEPESRGHESSWVSQVIARWCGFLSVTTSAVVLVGTLAVNAWSASGSRDVQASAGPIELGLVARSQGVNGKGRATKVSATDRGWSSANQADYESDHSRPVFHPYEVSAYAHGCIMPRSGIEGPPQKAADGRWPVPHWTVAADPSHPFGTVLELSYQGILTSRVVGDRGRAIKGRKLDLFMDSCENARRWGRRVVMVREVRRPLGAE